MGHSCSERLQMPLFGPVKTQLSVETVGVDLGRSFQENHSREAAAVGMGGVVIPSNLAIQPKIDQFQLVSPKTPWSASLRGLAVDDMADPAFASRQKVFLNQSLHSWLLIFQLPLLTELTGQF